MLCWILAFYDIDAVHFLKERFSQILRYVYSNMHERSVHHETQESLDVWNCKLGLDLRKPGGEVANIKVQTSLCIGSLISTFAIRLLENIVSRLASIKYTHLFPITVVSSIIDYILSFSLCAGSCYLICKVLEKTNIVLNDPLQKKQQSTRK